MDAIQITHEVRKDEHLKIHNAVEGILEPFVSLAPVFYKTLPQRVHLPRKPPQLLSHFGAFVYNLSQTSDFGLKLCNSREKFFLWEIYRPLNHPPTLHDSTSQSQTNSWLRSGFE